MAAIGAVDEANSALGLAAVVLADGEYAEPLYRIQNDLFDLGADLATPAEDEDDFSPSEMVLRVVEAQVVWLEQAIDAANTRPCRGHLSPTSQPVGIHKSSPGAQTAWWTSHP